MSDDSRVEWVRLSEAVCIISPHVGGDKKAKTTIANRMRDGTLDASCLWMAEGVDSGGCVPNRSLRYDSENIEAAKHARSAHEIWEMTVPTVSETDYGQGMARYVTPYSNRPMRLFGGFWKRALASNWKNDVKRWDWASGLVIIGLPPAVITKSPKVDLRVKLPSRWFAYDVRVDRSQLDAIYGSISAISKPDVKRSKAGRKRDPNGWGHWIAEAIKLERAGAISISMNANAFNDQVHEQLDQLIFAGKIQTKALDRDSTYDLANVIINHLHEHK